MEMNLSNSRVRFWQMVSVNSRLQSLVLASGAALVLCLSPSVDAQAAEKRPPNSKAEIQPLPMAAPIEPVTAAKTDQHSVTDQKQKPTAVKVGAALDSAMKAIFGVGMDQNYGLGAQHLNHILAADSRASAEDQAIARAWLGLIYYNGWGGKVDTIRALVLISEALPQLTKSAEAGQSIAQMTLGRLYRNGQGVNEDLPRARELLQRAANQGSAAANFYLGYMDQKGMGGEVNLKRAQGYYALSAAAGNSFGAYYLSQAYAQGWGGQVDVKSAKIWLDRAVMRKNPEALRAVALNKQAMVTTAAVKEAKPTAKVQIQKSASNPAKNSNGTEITAKKPPRQSREPVERIIEIGPKKYSNTGLTQAKERPSPTKASPLAGKATAVAVAEPRVRKPISKAARKSFDMASAESSIEAGSAVKSAKTPTSQPVKAVKPEPENSAGERQFQPP